MCVHAKNPKCSCALYFMTHGLWVKSISSRSDIPAEAQRAVWRQRGTGWSGYFYLRPRSELNTEGEAGGEWNSGNVWECESGNVNHLDSRDINCAWSSVSGHCMYCSNPDRGRGLCVCVWVCDRESEAERGRAQRTSVWREERACYSVLLRVGTVCGGDTQQCPDLLL